jgi:hypothetical protein
MNSSNDKGRSNLAGSTSSPKAKKLLEGLANLQDGESGFRWFQRNFPNVLDDVTPLVRQQSSEPTDSDESYPYYSFASNEQEKYKYWLLPLRASLRAVWCAPDTRTKQWGMFRISQDFFLQGHRDLIHPPLENSWDYLLELKPPTPTEQMLLEFLKWARLARYCDNPDCAAPYFIAAKRSQKYCSTPCSQFGQRESKQRWWEENGRRWRADRAKRSK